MPRHAANAFARALDLMTAATVLLATAPVMAVIAVTLWFDGGGPVLIGADRLRFRTERTDAERDAFGRFLWLTRLDELPQFVSLLKGDVSLFGADAPALSLGA